MANKDEANRDKMTGKAKEVAGKATGDDEMQSEGEAQRSKGEFEEKVEEGKDAARGAFESVKDRASGERGAGER